MTGPEQLGSILGFPFVTQDLAEVKWTCWACPALDQFQFPGRVSVDQQIQGG